MSQNHRLLEVEDISGTVSVPPPASGGSAPLQVAQDCGQLGFTYFEHEEVVLSARNNFPQSICYKPV